MATTMLVCKQCGNTWFPRVRAPQRCPDPHCQSRRWNKNLKDAKGAELREMRKMIQLRITSLQTTLVEVESQLAHIESGE